MIRISIMSPQTFIVVLETPTGEQIKWKTLARTGCKALMAATELMPDHEIKKVIREDAW